MKAIETLKNGEFFRKTPTAKKTFRPAGYNQSAKRYIGQNFDDISDFCYLKKGTLVFTDFEF